MRVKDKINGFLSSVGSSQPELAEALGLNYQRMNKNIAAGKLTIEVVIGLKKLYPQIDLNWLVSDEIELPQAQEPVPEYGENKLQKIRRMKKLLNDLEEEIANEMM